MNKKLFIVIWLIVGAISIGDAEAISLRKLGYCDIYAEFDTAAHSLKGKTTLTYLSGKERSVGFLLNEGMELLSVKLNDRHTSPIIVNDIAPIDISTNYGEYGKWQLDEVTIYVVKLARKHVGKEVQLEVEYAGEFFTELDNRQFSREQIAFEVSGTIGSEGIYLSAGAFWYPYLPDQLMLHKVTAKLPKGWNCVTDGFPIEEINNDDSFIITYVSDTPMNGVNFSAADFVVTEDEYDGITAATYFMALQAELATDYIEACHDYLVLYSNWISPYPFTRFSVVDNFIPSGYGMPGWTLIGSEVLRLPFIKHTSLGHEILHNWWGNSLLVDYREGNWCEGLTTYMADYYYKVRTSEKDGKEYRRDVLRDWANYVTETNDYPVTEFVSRTQMHDRAIGYGKVMMIFHMLENYFDSKEEGLFYKTLSKAYEENKWQTFAWSDWRRYFEKAADEDLGWFFDPWLNNTGVPQISLKLGQNKSDDYVNFYHDSSWVFYGNVEIQPPEVQYGFMLPVRALLYNGDVIDSVFLVKSNEFAFSMEGKGNFASVILDPDFQVMRHVYPGEIPITLSAFLGDTTGILVIPDDVGSNSDYRKAAEGLKRPGQVVCTDKYLKRVTDTDSGKHMLKQSLWLFGGNDNLFWERFASPIVVKKDSLWIEEQVFVKQIIATSIKANPLSPERSIVFTASTDEADIINGTRKLTHYGRYSALVFRNGDILNRQINQPNNHDLPNMIKY